MSRVHSSCVLIGRFVVSSGHGSASMDKPSWWFSGPRLTFTLVIQPSPIATASCCTGACHIMAMLFVGVVVVVHKVVFRPRARLGSWDKQSPFDGRAGCRQQHCPWLFDSIVPFSWLSAVAI